MRSICARCCLWLLAMAAYHGYQGMSECSASEVGWRAAVQTRTGSDSLSCNIPGHVWHLLNVRIFRRRPILYLNLNNISRIFAISCPIDRALCERGAWMPGVGTSGLCDGTTVVVNVTCVHTHSFYRVQEAWYVIHVYVTPTVGVITVPFASRMVFVCLVIYTSTGTACWK